MTSLLRDFETRTAAADSAWDTQAHAAGIGDYATQFVPSGDIAALTHTLSGGSTFTGTSGDDEFVGTSGDDTFNLGQGGADTASGNGGNDTFNLGSALTADDHIDGGAGTDTLIVGGNPDSTPIVLGADTITSIEKLVLKPIGDTITSVFGVGHFINLALDDGNLAAGATMTVDASALGQSDIAIVAGGQETDGRFVFTGHAGSDIFVGGAGNDVFHLESGGPSMPSAVTLFRGDAATGLGGNDSFYMGAHFTADSQIDGGSGTDTLYLNGDYSAGVVFRGYVPTNIPGVDVPPQGPTVQNVEKIVVGAGHSYSLTADYTTVAEGATMTVDGSALQSANSLTFDGSKAIGGLVLDGGAGNDTLIGGASHNVLNGGDGQDTLTAGGSGDTLNGGAGNDTLLGGLGNDTLIGGSGDDTINGGAGRDTLAGGGGHDTFVYASVSESSGGNYDHITDFDPTQDHLDLWFTVTGVDAAVHTGALSSASLTHDLHAALSGHLDPYHAVLFTPDSGTLAGHTFLVVEAGGNTGYQGGQDLVIDVTGGSHLGSLSTADFV